MQLFNVLNADELTEIRAIFECADWVAVNNSEKGGLTKESFHEAKLEMSSLLCIVKILERIFTTTIIKNFVFSKDILSVRCQRFEVGEGRSRQIDDYHVMSYKRDLSWVIFINDEDSCEGGALKIQSGGYERTANLGAGGIAIYKTGAATSISEVIKGKKEIITGGIESFIPSYNARETLYKLSEINELLRRLVEEEAIEVEKGHADRMNQAWHQIVRLLSSKEN